MSAFWSGASAVSISLAPRHLKLHVVRGLLLLGTTGFNFLAISYLQLAQTSAISFSNPLIVCVLSPSLLGEHVGLRRWMAVIVGFAGILMVIRPGTSGFHWAMIASVLSALCGALYSVATRHVGRRDQALTSLFYVTWTGALGALPIAAVEWQVPASWQWAMLGLIAVFGTLGHFLLTEAHRRAPASTLAPFSYTQIIPMIILGYLVFGDVPDALDRRWVVWWSLRAASMSSTASAGLPGARRPREGAHDRQHRFLRRDRPVRRFRPCARPAELPPPARRLAGRRRRCRRIRPERLPPAATRR